MEKNGTAHSEIVTASSWILKGKDAPNLVLGYI